MLGRLSLLSLHHSLMFTYPVRTAIVQFCTRIHRSRSIKLLRRKGDVFCWHLCLVNFAFEQLLAFSGFCFCIHGSPKSHLAVRDPNIHSVGTWDNMGGISIELVPAEASYILTLDLTRFYWNYSFVEVENNLFAQFKIFSPEEATMTFSLTSN